MTGRAIRVLSTAKDDRLRRASILSGSWVANCVPSKPFSTLDERSEWVWNGVGWELKPFMIKETEVEFECDGRSQLERVCHRKILFLEFVRK